MAGKKFPGKKAKVAPLYIARAHVRACFINITHYARPPFFFIVAFAGKNEELVVFLWLKPCGGGGGKNQIYLVFVPPKAAFFGIIKFY